MAATVPSEPGQIVLTFREKNHGPFQGWKFGVGEWMMFFLRWRINLGVFFFETLRLDDEVT